MEGSSIKNILKNDAVKMIGALTIVGVLSGIILVFIYTHTASKIHQNVNFARKTAIENLFPGTARVRKTKVEDVSEVTDEKGRMVGYAFIAEGNGYQGPIQMMVGMSADMKTLVGVEVLESQETPGLGAEIAGKRFRGQFDGLSITHPIEYVKNEKPQRKYQIEAITGATISSRAVVNILNKRIAEIRKELKG